MLCACNGSDVSNPNETVQNESTVKTDFVVQLRKSNDPESKLEACRTYLANGGSPNASIMHELGEIVCLDEMINSIQENFDLRCARNEARNECLTEMNRARRTRNEIREKQTREEAITIKIEIGKLCNEGMVAIEQMGDLVAKARVCTPMHLMADTDNSDALSLLINAGGDPRIIDTDGFDVYAVAADQASHGGCQCTEFLSTWAEHAGVPSASPRIGDPVMMQLEDGSGRWVRGDLGMHEGGDAFTVTSTSNSSELPVNPLKIHSIDQHQKYMKGQPGDAENAVSLRMLLMQISITKRLSRVDRFNQISRAFDYYIPPMVVQSYTDLKRTKKLSTSSEGNPVPIETIESEAVIIFFSHSWLTRFEGDDEGQSHPDNEDGLKATLVLKSLEYISENDGISLDNLYVWYDYICVDQTEEYPWPFITAVNAMPVYMSLCDHFFYMKASVGGKEMRYDSRMWCRFEQLVWFRVREMLGFNVVRNLIEMQNNEYDVRREVISSLDQVCKNPRRGLVTKDEDKKYLILMVTLLLGYEAPIVPPSPTLLNSVTSYLGSGSCSGEM